MTRVYLDIETFCEADLKKSGVYAYAEHPSFRVLMMAWAVEDEPVQLTTNETRIQDLVRRWLGDPDLRLVAHNAQFERVCLDRNGSPTRWHDTMAVAAEHGLPQSLEKLAQALGAEAKDPAGTRLINLFSKPNRKGDRMLPEDKPEHWQQFCDYCVQDVEVLRAVDRRLGEWPSATERQLWELDQVINDRGIAVDLDMARAGEQAAERNRERNKARITELTGVTNPRSVQQMMSWAQESGLELDNLRADTVTAALNTDELTETQREVLTLRQSLALSSSAKFSAAVLGAGSDSRLRGQFRFFGAHTGRWSGRGVQLQNLSRQSSEKESALIADLKLGEDVSDIELRQLIRPMLTGPFTVVDFSAIEARVLAWLAGEQWMLDAFSAGRDIYVETGERMGGLTRDQGKVAVLALGFGGGVGALESMNRGPMEGAQQLVGAYRDAVPRTRQFWHDLESAVADGGRAGRIGVERKGNHVRLWLPSNRAITYRDMTWDRWVQVDDDGKKLFREGWRYTAGHGGRTPVWGGTLTENVTQAVARDVLGEAMLALEAAGYRIVGHVHDEVLIEGEHSVEEVAAIMCRGTDWTRGLPLAAEGHRCDRYRKG